MDPILDSVRKSRAKLALRPREELVREMEEKVSELEALPPGSTPDFVLALAKKALHDLSASATEEVLLRLVSDWVRVSMADKNGARRHLTTEIGSFLLQAETEDSVREGDGHDWRGIKNNRLNFSCSRCNIVGYSVGAGQDGHVRAPYECADYRALTARPEGASV